MSEDLPFDIEAGLNRLWQDEDAASAITGLNYGQEIGRYRVRALLGSGSFGLVYLADDIETENPVALKVPRLEVLLNQDMRRRFRIEAGIVGRLNHEGIVEILQSDVDVESAMPFIACRWCTGPDLGVYLANNRPTWQESVRLMVKVCDAIHFAHRQGVAHRDIKPANIILHGDVNPSPQQLGLDCFSPKVTDFGLARLADPIATNTRTGIVLGTPAYMAPEQIIAGLGNQQNRAPHEALIASDIYSLGAVLFEMLNERPASTTSSILDLVRLQNNVSLVESLDWKPEIPAAVKKVVETSLRNNAAFRYQDAGEMAADLTKALSGNRVTGRPIHVRHRLTHWFRTRDWMKTAGYFAIVSQTIFAAWMILADLTKISFGLLTLQQYTAILPTLIWLALIGSASVIVAGVYCLRGRMIAPWIGAGLAIYNLNVPIRALFGDPEMFSEIYARNDPYLSFVVHFIMAIIFASQLVLFTFAIIQRLTETRFHN